MKIWLKSNFRFLKGHLILNGIKMMSNIIGISFFAYIWKFNPDNELLGFSGTGQEMLAVLASIILVTCISNFLIQRQAIAFRMRELFVWKWFGINRRKLFWMFFIEHFFFVAMAGILTIVLFDTFYLLITSSVIQVNYSIAHLFNPVLTASIFLTLCGIGQIILVLKMDKTDVFNKIPAQIKDNL